MEIHYHNYSNAVFTATCKYDDGTIVVLSRNRVKTFPVQVKLMRKIENNDVSVFNKRNVHPHDAAVLVKGLLAKGESVTLVH